MARPREFDEDQVLDAAVEVFWERGFDGTSLSDLTERMGIRRASIYGAFGDKRQLFLTVLARYQRQALAELREGLQSGSSPRDSIERVFRQRAEAVGQPGSAKGCLAVNSTVELASHDEEIARVLGEYRDAIERLFHDALQRGRLEGEFPPTLEVGATARFLTLNLVALLVMRRARASRGFAEDAVRVALGALDG